MNDYCTARQRHLGDTLDRLAGENALFWSWEYNVAQSRAVFIINGTRYDTRQAEEVVAGFMDRRAEPWLPVPHPGGRVEYHQMMATLRQGVT